MCRKKILKASKCSLRHNTKLWQYIWYARSSPRAMWLIDLRQWSWFCGKAIFSQKRNFTLLARDAARVCLWNNFKSHETMRTNSCKTSAFMWCVWKVHWLYDHYSKIHKRTRSFTSTTVIPFTPTLSLVDAVYLRGVLKATILKFLLCKFSNLSIFICFLESTKHFYESRFVRKIEFAESNFFGNHHSGQFATKGLCQRQNLQISTFPPISTYESFIKHYNLLYVS